MKHISLLTILIALVAATLMPSCRVAPTNGELDAQWQLLTIDNTDGTQTVPDERTYYCFYRHTANVTVDGGASATANLTYIEDRSLTLEFPNNTPDELERWSLPVAGLPAGQKGVTITFDINHLSSSKLVMTAADGSVYSLRKF